MASSSLSRGGISFNGHRQRIRHRYGAWLLLLLIIASAIAIVFIPAWLIQPFKPQTARAVQISYALRSWSPIVTVIASIAAIAVAVRLWRGKRSWWRRAVLVVSLLPLFLFTWLARQNHFEWMFNPLPNPAYAKASESSFVQDTDMVMAVAMNGEAVAYPVRQMAYHHVVHDTVGGVPIAVTY